MIVLKTGFNIFYNLVLFRGDALVCFLLCFVLFCFGKRQMKRKANNVERPDLKAILTLLYRFGNYQRTDTKAAQSLCTVLISGTFVVVVFATEKVDLAKNKESITVKFHHVSVLDITLSCKLPINHDNKRIGSLKFVARQPSYMSPTASLRQRTQCYHFSTWTTIHSGADLPHFSIRRNSIIPKSQIRESNLPRTTPYQQFKRKAPLVWPAGYLPCNSLCF